VADELERARSALATGNVDEALVLLWKAVEPARLAGDQRTLAQIAALAQQIPGHEADDLLKATGTPPDPTLAPIPTPEHSAPPRRSAFARALWAVIPVVLIAMIGLAYTRGDSGLKPPSLFGSRAQVTIDADGLYLVPLARYPQAELTEVGISVIREAGAVDIRSPVGLGPTTYDAQRNQFVAEELLRRLIEGYRIGEGRKVLLIGITSLEMYERGNSAEGQTTVTRADDGGYVVISTSAFGDDVEDRKARLREVLLAEIERAGLNRG
jgi:hypothetical protein